MTVTLPERTLTRLQEIDPDRARAIVNAVDMASGVTASESEDIEVVEIRKGIGYILVRSAVALQSIPRLTLLEVTPGRYLLAMPIGTAIESLEVSILDLLEHLPETEERDRRMLLRLRGLFKKQRRRKTVSKAEILFVATRDSDQGVEVFSRSTER